MSDKIYAIQSFSKLAFIECRCSKCQNAKINENVNKCSLLLTKYSLKTCRCTEKQLKSVRTIKIPDKDKIHSEIM